MRVALVHDWLNGMRGGEKCLEQLCLLLPGADLFTLLHEPGKISPALERHRITTSFLQQAPLRARYYRHYLPLFPRAIEGLSLEGYDLVVSLSHCVAKGARAPAGSPHVCYCFTPMRYIWDLHDLYFGPGRTHPLVAWAARQAVPRLRRWDVESAAGVDRFVAISDTVRERIERIYGREADRIYPPVDTDTFRPRPDAPDREGFYLVVSALAPYKGVDLAIEAVRGTGRKLVVVGTGQDERRLRALAGPEVDFRGWVSGDELRDAYGRCRAVLHACEEDFGIAPLEAQAMGAPVIGLRRGGLRETVVSLDDARGRAPTGLLFDDPGPEGLRVALDRFEREGADLDPAAMREWAERFAAPAFRQAFRGLLREATGEDVGAPEAATA